MSIYERRSRLVTNAINVLGKSHIPSVSRDSGVSSTSLYRLRSGKTRSPHLKTVEFALAALGHTLTMTMNTETAPAPAPTRKRNGK